MRILLVIFACLSFLSSWSQEAVSGLELFHREKRTTLSIPLGTELVVKKAGERLKGTLEAITEDGIVVSGVTHSVRDIVWLGQRTGFTKGLAIGMGVVGAGILSAGIVYVTLASGAGFIGTGLITAGGAGIGTLGYSFFRNGKRHYLDSDWMFVPPA